MVFAYSANQHAELAQPDRFAMIKQDYLQQGAEPSNLRYGYIRKTS
jgi:hypothetical protein